MAQVMPAEVIDASIQNASIEGQVAVGKYILQIGSVHGGVVNVALPEQKPRLQAHATPVLIRPRPFPNLLDRQPVLEAAIKTLQAAQPVEFYGQPGLGKTTLLRHLAHHTVSESFPDGVIYLVAGQQPAPDLLQFLFEAFYESDRAFKPTEAQLRQALQRKQALILLDDVESARADIERVMNGAPACTFILASTTRHLWGEGRVAALQGLPPDDALALIERELEHPLSAADEEAARSLCSILAGHPLRLLQTIALVRDEGRSLAELVRQLKADSPAEALEAQLLDSRSEPERRVLGILGVFGSYALPAEHVTALAGFDDAGPILERLLQQQGCSVLKIIGKKGFLW